MGYALAHGFDLPPLMFTEEALALGAGDAPAKIRTAPGDAARGDSGQAASHSATATPKDARPSAPRPLAVAFWGKVWSLASWCETRHAFRGFRLDRMEDVTLGAAFLEEEDKSLDAFIRHVTAEVAQRKRVD